MTNPSDSEIEYRREMERAKLCSAHLSAMVDVCASMAMSNAIGAISIVDSREAADAAGKMLGWQMMGPLLMAGMDVDEAMKAVGLKK
jgi:hypothetical protein